MTITCPFCTSDIEFETSILERERVKCSVCQNEFLYFAELQNRICEKREHVWSSAYVEYQNWLINNFQRKEMAKARRYIKTEYLRSSCCFVRSLLAASAVLVFSLVIAFWQWYEFAIKLNSAPGKLSYWLLFFCIAGSMINVFEINSDENKKRHKPRTMVVWSTCALVISALIVQLLAGYAHCPFDKSRQELQEQHYKVHSDWISNEQKKWTFDENHWAKEKCPQCSKYEESLAKCKSKYDEDRLWLNLMCWGGTVSALLGYILAYRRFRKDLLS